MDPVGITSLVGALGATGTAASAYLREVNRNNRRSVNAKNAGEKDYALESVYKNYPASRSEEFSRGHSESRS